MVNHLGPGGTHSSRYASAGQSWFSLRIPDKHPALFSSGGFIQASLSQISNSGGRTLSTLPRSWRKMRAISRTNAAVAAKSGISGWKNLGLPIGAKRWRGDVELLAEPQAPTPCRSGSDVTASAGLGEARGARVCTVSACPGGGASVPPFPDCSSLLSDLSSSCESQHFLGLGGRK